MTGRRKVPDENLPSSISSGSTEVTRLTETLPDSSLMLILDSWSYTFIV